MDEMVVDSGHGTLSSYGSLGDDSGDVSYNLAANVRGVSRTPSAPTTQLYQHQLQHLQQQNFVNYHDMSNTNYYRSDDMNEMHNDMRTVPLMRQQRQRGVDQSVALPPECHFMMNITNSYNCNDRKDIASSIPVVPTQSTKRVKTEPSTVVTAMESLQENMRNDNVVFVRDPSWMTSTTPVQTVALSPTTQTRERKIVTPSKSTMLSSMMNTGSPIVSPEVTRPICTQILGANNSSSNGGGGGGGNTVKLQHEQLLPPIHPSTPKRLTPRRLQSSPTSVLSKHYTNAKSSSPVSVRPVLPRVVAMNHTSLLTSSAARCDNYHPSNNYTSNCSGGGGGDCTTTTTTNNSNVISVISNSRTTTPDNHHSHKASIEITPGVSIHLRGAQETQHAINTGFYVQCECMICSLSGSNMRQQRNNNGDEIYCILDCDYYICPNCRSVQPNPLSSNSNPSDLHLTAGTIYPGGLGLGFRLANGKYRP